MMMTLYQNDDFIFNIIKLTNSWKISDNELKFEPHIGSAKADIILLRP